MKDVVVSVRVDDKPKAMEELEILLVSTKTLKEAQTYTDLEEISKDWGKDSTVYGMSAAMFNQGDARPAPPKLIRKVTILGAGEVETPDKLVEALKEYSQKNNNWYVFLTDRAEDEYIQKLSEFAQKSEPTEAELVSGAEDHRKVYFARTANKELDGVNARSIVIYAENPEEYAEAAYLGAVAPWYPKHVTWKFKMPKGIRVPELTTSEMDSLERKHINFVSDEYKNNYVKNGVCADGEWIDSLFGADWIAQEMRNELYGVFMQNEVVPYTDEGFTLIGMAVFRALNKAVDYGIIASDSESASGIFKVSIPARATATEEQARSRVMPDILWEAQLQGAVHGTVTRGVLKVNL